MILGIDIDDCIVMNSDYFVKHIVEEDLPEPVLNNIMANIHDIGAGIVREELYPYLRPIWKKYNVLYSTYPYVSDVLCRLKKRGVKILIVTGRSNKMLEGVEDVTKEYLTAHNVIYDEIIFNAHNKQQICLDYGINIFVEDSIRHAKAISEVGVKTLLFNSCVNENEKTNITRVFSWLEIENIINTIIDNNM